MEHVAGSRAVVWRSLNIALLSFRECQSDEREEQRALERNPENGPKGHHCDLAQLRWLHPSNTHLLLISTLPKKRRGDCGAALQISNPWTSQSGGCTQRLGPSFTTAATSPPYRNLLLVHFLFPLTTPQVLGPRTAVTAALAERMRTADVFSEKSFFTNCCSKVAEMKR